MSKLQVTQNVRFATLAAFAAVSVATQGFAQDTVAPPMHYGVIPWTGGGLDDAIFQGKSATTIPMSHYSISSSRGTYTGVLVGGNPFATDPKPVTIDAVVIPLIIEIRVQHLNDIRSDRTE